MLFQLHPPCFRSNESQWIETAVLIHPMQHWSSTTHAEFGHKHNILVSWPLPFDFKLIGYPKLKCKGCYWRAVHLLPQVCSFQSVTPGLKRWKMRNTSATSDVIWHQAFCWEIPATLPKRHQLFCFGSVKVGTSILSLSGISETNMSKAHLSCDYMQRFCQQLTQPFFVHRAAG